MFCIPTFAEPTMTSPRTTAFTIDSVYSPGAVTAGTLEPVAPWERIHGLDLLRGFAMFGVMWSNLRDVVQSQ
jgi:hypothetical protein